MRAAASSFPRHHVPRTRLIDAVRDAPVVTIVAGGGYGKSVLAAELVHALGLGTSVVQLEAGDDDPELLWARITRSLRASGLSDAAAAAEAAGGPSAGVGRLVDALADSVDPLLLVFDEVEHAGAESGRLLGRLARELPEPHRLVLVGRTLGRARAALRSRPGTQALGPRDLAFTEDESERVLAHLGAGGAVGPSEILGLAGGWPIAIVLAGERLARSPNREEELGRLSSSSSLIEGLVEEQLSQLTPADQAALVQVAHLPELTSRVIAEATGNDGLETAAAAAGIPLELAADGRVELPDPIREVLIGRAPLDPDVATRAAAAYVATGSPADAVHVLVAARLDDAAAATVADLTPANAGRLDFRELNALLASVTPAALDRHPRALLHLARACEAAAERKLRSDLLERIARAARDDEALEREIEAERARDLIRDGEIDAAAEIAERLVRDAGADELQTRVRALHVLGRTHAWRGPPGFAAAEPLLEEAAELYGRLGFVTARAHALLALAYDVQTLAGRFDEAVATLERARSGLPGRSRLRGIVLIFAAEALIDLGRLREAEAALAEAERLGGIFGDTRTLGYAAWLRARVLAPAGDVAGVSTALAAAEQSRGEWFEHHSGAEFLAEAALLLDQVGAHGPSRRYLERALERESESPRYVQLAAGAIEARSGDPARAESVLAAVAARDDLEAREVWRVALLRAHAAQRRGDAGAAALLAREAFDAAGRTGALDLPQRREPVLASLLVEPAASAGSETALRLLPTGALVALAVLGTFELRREGEALSLPPGRPTLLVKLLAVRRARVGAEEAIEALWPGVDAPSGRKRLRNVLNRLKDSVGDLVIREGESLAFTSSAEIDASLFEQTATAALADASPERARAALELYRGDLLPDDRYAGWTAEPRERLRRLALDLLDLLVDRAEADGEIDEALRLLERGIEADRLDETRYLRRARLLMRQGKRGRAIEVLRTAAAAMRELGLEPSEEHRALVRTTRA